VVGNIVSRARARARARAELLAALLDRLIGRPCSGELVGAAERELDLPVYFAKCAFSMGAQTG
jgi:hypothetical protein